MKQKRNFTIPTWLICVLFALWPLYGLPLLLGIILLFIKTRMDKHVQEETNSLKSEFEQLKNSITPEMFEPARLDAEIQECSKELETTNLEIARNNELIATLSAEIQRLQEKSSSLDKSILTQTRKIDKCRELYKSIDYCISSFIGGDTYEALSSQDALLLDEYAPSVLLKLHSMDIKSLRKASNDNNRQIDRLLSLYSSRYTTKTNQAIYQLMVIALRAELQNILYNLKYEKLDKAVEQVKSVTAKYLAIATSGNQSISGTLTRFIGEAEYLFINAVKIEYNYYVKKEQAKQEQLAIREQMRQEAEERRALELERKKIEAEESKYNDEINKLENQLSSANESEITALNKRIAELQSQLSNVIVEKEKIIELANGKAGYVYIISNLGSFGDDVFKIGMTRRKKPQERVDELGDASVPFRFDVHSFIFSNDAVELESSLHKQLDSCRVNKVNRRKEFFRLSIDNLEGIVIVRAGRN